MLKGNLGWADKILWGHLLYGERNHKVFSLWSYVIPTTCFISFVPRVYQPHCPCGWYILCILMIIWCSSLANKKLMQTINPAISLLSKVSFDLSLMVDDFHTLSLSHCTVSDIKRTDFVVIIFHCTTVVGHKLYQARQICFFSFSILLGLNHKR